MVVIGNMMTAYGPFESHDEAKEWCEMADYSSLTDHGRMGTTIVPIREPAKGWAFKVRVEVTPLNPAAWWSETVMVIARSFEDAEAKAIAQAQDKYPGHVSYTAWDAAIRN